jgi:hypothetical protein
MNQRLHPGLLELAGHSGAQAVEIFAARQHFDYTAREQVAELAAWFRSNPLQAWSMHAPLYFSREMGRAGAPAVNLLHPEKARRIDAMDEIKRALEAAEQIPFRNIVVHLGERTDAWSQRTIEYAFIALEYLDAFARPLGVRLLVENLPGDPTTPEHLMEILTTGHLDSIGVCLDLGHAHFTVGVPEAIATLAGRIVQVHAHDNHGLKDEQRCWKSAPSFPSSRPPSQPASAKPSTCSTERAEASNSEAGALGIASESWESMSSYGSITSSNIVLDKKCPMEYKKCRPS